MIEQFGPDVYLSIDGEKVRAPEDKPLVQVLQEIRPSVGHVCYHRALGALETCDTCFVRVNGELRRSCSTPIKEGMEVSTRDLPSQRARHEALQRLLYNHDLYCTICATATETAKFITPFRRLSNKSMISLPSLCRWTRRTRFTDTTRASVLLAEDAWKRARTSRSTRRSLLIGRRTGRTFCGMAGSPSTIRAASLADTA